MTGAFVLVGGLFGLLLGSFLNVVVYRTPRHLSVVQPGFVLPVMSGGDRRDRQRAGAVVDLARRQVPSLRPSRSLSGTRSSKLRQQASSPAWPPRSGLFGGSPAGGRSPRPWASRPSSKQTVSPAPPAVTVIGCSIGVAALAIGAGDRRARRAASFSPASGSAPGSSLRVRWRLHAKVRESLGVGALVTLAPLGACLGWLGALAVGRGLGRRSRVDGRDGAGLKKPVMQKHRPDEKGTGRSFMLPGCTSPWRVVRRSGSSLLS